ncbi:hypothetical protein H310_07945 [Aphanomyces invadans]|uniref:EH domain-containing protein n=1 Tax=Aphanomyces invadans TaxID=157072 RepID=A0A024U2W7_9STRA|nr:hypothetical protein H310_07945 [Aphanomyces invadans]ETV99917.1 hypothetical protein H310_07945 [Aphanomyces invadans]|eukprot:XP_008871693.1 hypothetical protein H310_07945 [Aphanomyces invadans]
MAIPGSVMWKKGKEEEAFYTRMFQLADVDKTGKVEGKTAVEFFTTSGLPATILKQVWSLASTNMQPYLNQDEFNVALGLIALAQCGDTLDLDRLAALGNSHALPLPVLHIDGANSKDFVMAATDEYKYKTLFRDAVGGDVDGTITATAAMELFQKSGMPLSELQEIYRLVDSGMNTGLQVATFTIAMHLIVCKTRRGMAQIPTTIPMELFPTLALPPIKLDQVATGQNAAAMLELQLGAQKQLVGAVAHVPAASLTPLEVHLNAVEALGYALPPSARQAPGDSASLSELEAVLLRYIAQVTQELLVLQQQDKTAPVVPVHTLLQTLTNLKQQSARLVEQKEAALRCQPKNQPHHHNSNLHVDVDKSVTSSGFGFSTSFDASFDNAAKRAPAQSFEWTVDGDPFSPNPPPPIASAAPTFVAADGASLFSPTPSTHASFAFDGSAGTGGSSSAKPDQFVSFQSMAKPAAPAVILDAFAAATTSTFNAFDAMNEMDLSVTEKYIVASPETTLAEKIAVIPTTRSSTALKRSTSATSDNVSLSRRPSMMASVPPPSLSATGRSQSSSFADEFAPKPVEPQPVAAFGAFDADTALSAPSQDSFASFAATTAAPGIPSLTDASSSDFGDFSGDTSFPAFDDAPSFHPPTEQDSFETSFDVDQASIPTFSTSFDSVVQTDAFTADFGKFEASFAAFGVHDTSAATASDGFDAPAFAGTTSISDGFGAFCVDGAMSSCAPSSSTATNDDVGAGFGDLTTSSASPEPFGLLPAHDPSTDVFEFGESTTPDSQEVPHPASDNDVANGRAHAETSDRPLGSGQACNSPLDAVGFSTVFGDVDGSSGADAAVSFSDAFAAPSFGGIGSTSTRLDDVGAAFGNDLDTDNAVLRPTDVIPRSDHRDVASSETPSTVHEAPDAPEDESELSGAASTHEDADAAAAGRGCLFGLPKDDAPFDDRSPTSPTSTIPSTDQQTTAPMRSTTAVDMHVPATDRLDDWTELGAFPMRPAAAPTLSLTPDAFATTVVAADTDFVFPVFDAPKPSVPPAATTSTNDDIFGDFTLSTSDRRVATDPFLPSFFSDNGPFTATFATEPANVADATNSFANFADFQASVGTSAWDVSAFPAPTDHSSNPPAESTSVPADFSF